MSARLWVVGRSLRTIVESTLVVVAEVDADFLAFNGRARFGVPENLPAPFDDIVGTPIEIIGNPRRLTQPQPPPAPKPKCETPPAPERSRKKRRKKKGGKRIRSKRFSRIRHADRICRYCMDAPAESVDHILPLSRGGSNGHLNLVGCCHQCNTRKDDQTPREAGMVLHIPLRWFR